MNRPGQWKPGQSGNPAGRPVGARQKISEMLLEDLRQVWKAKGRKALERLADEDSGKFAQIAYALLPKDVFPQIDGGPNPIKFATIQRVIVDPRAGDRLEGSVPEQPRQLTYQPPLEIGAEIQRRFADAVAMHVPRANERPAEELLDEVFRIVNGALRMHYGC